MRVLPRADVRRRVTPLILAVLLLVSALVILPHPTRAGFGEATLNPTLDTYVDSCASTTAHGSLSYWLVGPDGGGTCYPNAKYRAFLKWGLGGIPGDATITTTVLSIHWKDAGGIAANDYPRNFLIHRPVSDWDNNLAWNNQPGVEASPLTNFTRYYEVDVVRSYTLPNSVVQGWLGDPNTNFGIRISDENETNVNGVRAFSWAYSLEDSGGRWAQLYVQYETPEPQPRGPGEIIEEGVGFLVSSASSADAWFWFIVVGLAVVVTVLVLRRFSSKDGKKARRFFRRLRRG